MWVSKVFSAAAASIDIPIVCNEHHSNDMQSCGDDSYKEEELYKVLLYIKIKVLDPFLFLTSYSSKLLTYWAIESGILPDSGYISQKDIKEHKETICSVDCIVNFSLLALTKVCFPCAKKNDQPAEWFCNTSDDKETCYELKNCLHLNEAIKCVEKYNSIIKKINEQIEMDEQAVAAVFLITFMLRYEAFELSSLQSICKRADDRILEVDQIFVCNNFIGKNEACKISEYRNFINVYSMLLEARPKNVVLLYKRLKAYLALGMNIDAELDGVRLVTLLPTWCKGYHALASVLSFQGLLHSAHKIADIGSMNCKNPLNCQDIVLLKESKEMWMSKCTWCNVQQNESSPDISNVHFVAKPKHSILSQTEDLPGLTDPSDSEESSHGEDLCNLSSKNVDIKLGLTSKMDPLCDVPDLTDPSDSEESSEIDEKVPFGNSMEGRLDQRNALWSLEDMKLNKKKRKHGRYKLSISRIKSENYENSHAEKLQYFESLLKEGLLAMKSGSAHEALRKYHAALMEHKSYPQVCNLSEWDTICLKYAYGSACCDSGNFEDLNKAIGTFTDIMNSSNLRIIPTVLYGLGRAYFKLNRFKEALGHFKKVESYFDNEENFPIFYWPSTKDVIEETSPKNLKVELKNLINKCENPPLPLATCRHEHCLLTTEIYSCDPNFKGFYSIQCQDKCLLQYHPACWKSIKESLDRTDKDFLGQQCLTPDCDFIVTVVMCFGKDESPEKCFMIQENEKSGKQKKTKLKKKLESKEVKKKNSKKINLTQITVLESSENFGNQDQNSREIQNVVIEEQIIANDEVIKNEVSNKVPEKVESGLSVDAKPFFFQKKEYDMEKEIQKDCDKTAKPMTLCAEEFHSQSSNFSYYNEYQKRLHVLQENKRIVEERNLTHWSTFCETYRNPELDPTRPFHIPEGLREDPEALDAVLQSYNTLGETDVLRTLKDSMFGYFEDILTSNGPMHLDDCRLLAEIPGFSDEFQKLIENSGGLKKFLLQSMRFAVVGDHVCVIQDVVKAYSVTSKLQNSKKVYESDDCDDIFFSSATEKNIAENELYNGFHSYLNPHALEYNPCTNQNASISSPANSEPSDIQFMNCNSFPCDKRNELDTVDSARNSHNSADVIQLFFSKNSDLFSEAVCDSKNIFDQFKTDGFDKEPEGESFSTIPCETFINPSPSPSSPIISSKNMSVTISLKEENVCSISDHSSVSDYQTVIPLCLSKQQDKSIQVGTPQVKISKDVMEKDNEFLLEFKKIKELENNLKLKSEHMDNVLEILSNDVKVTKEKCEKVCEYWESKRKISEENESKANEQLEALSEKYKILCERFNRKCEMSEKMKEFLRKVEMNLESERKAKCEIQVSLKSAAEDQEKIVAEMKKRVMNAELQALTVRKANVLEKIDFETKNTEGKIKELEDGLKICEKNLPAFYLDGFMKLHCEMEEYIKELKDIRSKFLLCADEHKSAIQKEQTCDDLPSLTMPILPKFPSLKPQCLDDSEHLMNKMLDPMQPSAMYFQPQNAPVLCSLSGFNSTLPTVVSHNNFQTSIYNNSCELSEKNVSGNNVVINQFPFSMTKNVSAKSLKKAAPPGLAPQINAVQSRFSTVDNSFSSPVVNSPPCTSFPMSPSCPVVLNAPCQANAVQKMQTFDKCSAVSNPDFENLDSLNDSTLNSANDVCPSISKGHSAVQSSELYTFESSMPSSDVKAIEEIIAVSECSETPVKLQDFSKSSQLSSIPPACQSKPKNFTLPETGIGSKKKSIGNQDMLSGELENDTSVPLNFENATSRVNPCSFSSVKSSENFSLSGHNSSVSVLSFTGDDSKLQHKSQAKNSYEKLLVKLQGRYPHLSRGELMNHVTTYRQRCNNKLTGIPLDQIVSNVSLIIENCYPRKKVKLSKPKVLVNKPSLPPHDSKSSAGPVEKTVECPWANALARDKPKWRGEPLESSCAVCLEEMDNSSAYTADCGHIFHLLCIRKWLQTTSNCPVCRRYVLLPEDYPSLD